ncbi:hypothetical protein HNQ78_002299 [Phycisphaera mikurensis]|nr:hypothetical protein [Phycisphaera mikurensis]
MGAVPTLPRLRAKPRFSGLPGGEPSGFRSGFEGVLDAA